MKILSWFKTATVAVMTMVSVSLFVPAAMAQAVADPAVTAAATEFSDVFGLNMSAVGGAIIAAAFLAVGYKWVKGAIFS